MFRLIGLSMLVLSFIATAAVADESYPSRPITMVVPFPPGGVAELVGRPLAASMQPLLKQLRESSQAAPPFAPTSAEKQLRALQDAELARQVVRGGRFPVVERLAQGMLRGADGVRSIGSFFFIPNIPIKSVFSNIPFNRFWHEIADRMTRAESFAQQCC